MTSVNEDTAVFFLSTGLFRDQTRDLLLLVNLLMDFQPFMDGSAVAFFPMLSRKIVNKNRS